MQEAQETLQHSRFFTRLVHFGSSIFNQFPICSVCSKHTVMK